MSDALVCAGYLSEVLKIAGPFLVVVPLSTVPNWIKEFRKWTPQLNALVYVGDSKSRDVIRNYEFFNHKGAARPYRFEVQIFGRPRAPAVWLPDFEPALQPPCARLANCLLCACSC